MDFLTYLLPQPGSPNPMTPQVDLVIVFKSSSGRVEPKALARANLRAAEEQYSRLLAVLTRGGLKAVGKRGERGGQLLVLVKCPDTLLKKLAQRERHSDFLSGLPTSHSVEASDLDSTPPSPADRLRLIHTYITSTQADGGLGVAPKSPEWNRVESIMALHDRLFNDTWIRSWTTRQLGLVHVDTIKEQFGDAIALYFSFLSSYTLFLTIISLLGLFSHLFSAPYSSLYSSLLLIWSIAFVEYWRIQQRKLSVRWGTRGSFRVEKRRAGYKELKWWQRELRVLSSVPVVLGFGCVLVGLLTGIFVFEAFVTQLYKGPGATYISFAPTILFVILIPRVLDVYHSYAVAHTNWENHCTQSAHDASLTIKTFSLSALVAFGGLALSAFVYVPFGEEVMGFVQTNLFHGNLPGKKAQGWATSVLTSITSSSAEPTPTDGFAKAENVAAETVHLWETDHSHAREKLNPKRLQEQMFAITVTNQVVGNFLEVGLPYITRFISNFRARKVAASSSTPSSTSGKKKRVAFSDSPTDSNAESPVDEVERKEEREFMERVRTEAALPEYELFADYSEMVTQFGYVALWSGIWPLAPVMSLLNNWLELRSDALKISAHVRRPIPARTDTIGPWLDALEFLTWLAALTNSALVYLFRPADHKHPFSSSLNDSPVGTKLQHHHTHLVSASSGTRELLWSAVVVALAASHGYIVLRLVIRHVLERALWKGSKEEREGEEGERRVKREYLRAQGLERVVVGELAGSELLKADGEGEKEGGFWGVDEGLEELRRGLKDQ